MQGNRYLFILPALACLTMAGGCAFIGAEPPSPDLPRIARYHSKWTVENHTGMCEEGWFIGKSIQNLGIGIGGMEGHTSDEWPYPIYSIYETYETTSAPYGGVAFGASPLQDRLTYLNRYDFYVDENNIVVKCVPDSRVIDKRTRFAD